MRAAGRPERAGREDLIKEFSDPLAGMDSGSFQRLRNRCIRIALAYTIVGAALTALLIWADGAGGDRSGRLGGGLMGAGVMIFALFFYGIFRLCTIKRSMVQKRRDEILRQDRKA